MRMPRALMRRVLAWALEQDPDGQISRAEAVQLLLTDRLNELDERKRRS